MIQWPRHDASAEGVPNFVSTAVKLDARDFKTINGSGHGLSLGDTGGQLPFLDSIRGHRRDGHPHLKVLLATAQDHAAHGRDIAEVATPAQGDVVVLH